MNVEFFAGLLYGVPLGAAMLAAIAIGLAELGRQRSTRLAVERHRLDLAEDAKRRYVAVCLAPYASDAKLDQRPITDRVSRVKGRDVLRRMGARDE